MRDGDDQRLARPPTLLRMCACDDPERELPDPHHLLYASANDRAARRVANRLGPPGAGWKRFLWPRPSAR